MQIQSEHCVYFITHDDMKIVKTLNLLIEAVFVFFFFPHFGGGLVLSPPPCLDEKKKTHKKTLQREAQSIFCLC